MDSWFSSQASQYFSDLFRNSDDNLYSFAKNCPQKRMENENLKKQCQGEGSPPHILIWVCQISNEAASSRTVRQCSEPIACDFFRLTVQIDPKFDSGSKSGALTKMLFSSDIAQGNAHALVGKNHRIHSLDSSPPFATWANSRNNTTNA
jgi:hypothetical protein